MVGAGGGVGLVQCLKGLICSGFEGFWGKKGGWGVGSGFLGMGIGLGFGEMLGR